MQLATEGLLVRAGGASIAYHRRSGRPGLPGVVFLGGFRSDMTGVKATALDGWCAARDQSFVRFDYQGHGRSSTAFEDCTLGTWLGDALAVFDELTAGPQVLVGSSMGGWIALLVALARPERVAGIVGVAVATDFTEALLWPRLPAEQQRALLADGSLRVSSPYDPDGYVLTRDLIEDGRRHLLLERPIELACPVRLLHGMQDPDVPWQHSLQLVDALSGRDVTVMLLKDGDHRLSTPADLMRLEAAVAELSALQMQGSPNA